MNKHLTLKNFIKEKRKEKKLTQTELAELIGSTKNTISALETGQFAPSAYVAALLCNALDCTFEELFTLDLED